MDFQRIEKEMLSFAREEFKDFREDVTKFKNFYSTDEIPKLVKDRVDILAKLYDRRFPYPRHVTREQNIEFEHLRWKYLELFKEHAIKYAKSVIR